nr:MAG TPA: hypothetical protein [Caudoviricetes sp.]
MGGLISFIPSVSRYFKKGSRLYQSPALGSYRAVVERSPRRGIAADSPLSAPLSTLTSLSKPFFQHRAYHCFFLLSLHSHSDVSHSHAVAQWSLGLPPLAAIPAVE